MKSIFKFSNLAFLAVMVLFTLSSCGDDDEIIIDPGPVGIAVADGFYLASTAADPTGSDVLVAEKVEDSGYASQVRDGFIGNYIFVSGGSYNIVEIVDKAITTTWGGTTQTITDENSACDYNDYTLVELTDGGAAVSISEGLYKVTYDGTTKEMIIYKIEKAGVIGSATPNGWSDDTLLEGTIGSDGASWSAENVTMEEGEFKARFNCRWVIDRRINPDDGFLPENKYQLFTNFGGTTTAFETGGSNIPWDDTQVGIYTVTLNWTSADGFTINLEKTGEVVTGDFLPEEHQWAITGDATANGWPDEDPDNDPIGVDYDLAYIGLTGNIYTWEIESVEFIQEGKFKFRQNDNWADPSLGWNQIAISGDVSNFSDANGDGSDFVVAAAGIGSYKITITTNDEGSNYSAVFTKL